MLITLYHLRLSQGAFPVCVFVWRKLFKGNKRVKVQHKLLIFSFLPAHPDRRRRGGFKGEQCDSARRQSSQRATLWGAAVSQHAPVQTCFAHSLVAGRVRQTKRETHPMTWWNHNHDSGDFLLICAEFAQHRQEKGIFSWAKVQDKHNYFPRLLTMTARLPFPPSDTDELLRRSRGVKAGLAGGPSLALKNASCLYLRGVEGWEMNVWRKRMKKRWGINR